MPECPSRNSFHCFEFERMNAVDPIPVLDYPRDLYVCSFSYRTARGYITLAAGVIMTIPFICLGLWGPMFRLMFLACGFFGIAMTGAVAFQIIIGSTHVVRLTTAGVESRGRLVPWSKITRVAANGKPFARTVQLFYTVQLMPGVTTSRLISMWRGISTARYEQLVETLKPELSAAYPNLEIGGYFAVEI
jgi:hypothetical protein